MLIALQVPYIYIYMYACTKGYYDYIFADWSWENSFKGFAIISLIAADIVFMSLGVVFSVQTIAS